MFQYMKEDVFIMESKKLIAHLMDTHVNFLSFQAFQLKKIFAIEMLLSGIFWHNHC